MPVAALSNAHLSPLPTAPEKGLLDTMLFRPLPRQARPTRPVRPFWLALFAVLNGCDLLTTYVDLNVGMREGNPLMRNLLYQYGFGALIFYKALMVLVVCLGIVALNRSYPHLARITLGICNVLVLLVVISNFLQSRL